MHSLRLSIACSIALLTISGCSSMIPSFYRVDVRQGNYIDQAMVAELKPGMSKDQVRFLLGTPLLSDPFHPNRWDFIYRVQKGTDQAEQRRISLFFEGELLSRIEGDLASP